MTTILADLEPETIWNLWLSRLAPFEFHFVMHHELEWHDEFIKGDLTIEEIEQRITEAFS